MTTGKDGVMKALSIKQPWASLICSGLKNIENRSWPTKLRGRIYIHASKGWDDSWDSDQALLQIILEAQLEIALPHGAIIGEVEIVDCVTESSSLWFTGPYGFVLRSPVLYDRPIPAKGRLGFWEVERIGG